jgi:hypothetical protein
MQKKKGIEVVQVNVRKYNYNWMKSSTSHEQLARVEFLALWLIFVMKDYEDKFHMIVQVNIWANA